MKEQCEEKLCALNIKYAEETNFILRYFPLLRVQAVNRFRFRLLKRYFELVLAPSQRKVSTLRMLKFILEQALKAQRGSRRIAVLFL